MPNYQVVRCANDNCAKFQSQQEKKTGKWACVVCGLKQSLNRVYFQSNVPKECRSAVMELNMNRGQAESAKLKHAILAEQTSQCYDDAPNISIHAGQEVASWNSGDVEASAKSESRWATYTDNAEEASARLEDDPHDLDQFSRVVVGRIEQSETNKQVATGTKQRKPPAPRVVSRIASATLASNQLPSARHMPYKRPDSQASTLARDKPSFSQALASSAQRGSSAKLPAVTTASNNHSLEVVAASNSRSVQSDKVETQDMGENASASRWNNFDSDDSDADSEDSQS